MPSVPASRPAALSGELACWLRAARLSSARRRCDPKSGSDDLGKPHVATAISAFSAREAKHGREPPFHPHPGDHTTGAGKGPGRVYSRLSAARGYAPLVRPEHPPGGAQCPGPRRLSGRLPLLQSTGLPGWARNPHSCVRPLGRLFMPPPGSMFRCLFGNRRFQNSTPSRLCDPPLASSLSLAHGLCRSAARRPVWCASVIFGHGRNPQVLKLVLKMAERRILGKFGLVQFWSSNRYLAP